VAATIPEYRVTAHNTGASSDNKIHDDTVARRFGFRGALVPGTTVYAYMTRAIIGVFGMEWLARGQASLRLLKPVYDADEVIVRAAATAERTLEVTAANSSDEACATVRASIPSGAVPVVDVVAYPLAELPAERPPASREVLQRLARLGAPKTTYDEAAAADYLQSVNDPTPMYRGDSGFAHPALFLQLANRALSENVRLGPWIHVGSEVQHLGLARVGQRIDARGRVARLFEKKGHEFVELDLLLIGNEVRPIARVRHTAIYQVASGSPDASESPN
jgi:hypothetical protein